MDVPSDRVIESLRAELEQVRFNNMLQSIMLEEMTKELELIKFQMDELASQRALRTLEGGDKNAEGQESASAAAQER